MTLLPQHVLLRFHQKTRIVVVAISLVTATSVTSVCVVVTIHVVVVSIHMVVVVVEIVSTTILVF